MAALRLASALALGAVPCLSTTPAQAQKKNEVVVRCQDEKERPVADVEVHLFQRRKLPNGRGDYRSFGPYRIDAKGQVRCPTVVTFDGGRYDRLAYARIPDRLVGGGRSVWTRSGIRDGSLVEVRLVPSRTLAGVVKVPDKHRPDSVLVRVLSMYALDGRQENFGTLLGRSQVFAGLERILPEVFECGVAADGTFKLRDVPKEARVYLACEGPGLAHAQWANFKRGFVPLPKEVEISMEVEAVLSGHLEGPAEAPLKGAAVWIRLSVQSTRPPLYTREKFHTETDAKGHFQIVGLPYAEFELHVVPIQKEWTARPRRPKMLGAAEHRKDVVVKIVRAIEVKGTVAGAKGAIERAMIIAVTADAKNPLRMGGCMTDTQGRFTLHLPPGEAQLYFGSVPNGYVYPRRQIVAELELDAHRAAKPVQLWLEQDDR